MFVFNPGGQGRAVRRRGVRAEPSLLFGAEMLWTVGGGYHFDVGECGLRSLAHSGFDLLHRGHVKLLAEARAACDRLVVGLNSDASVRRLKGKGRPINPAEGRAEVLAALEAVDLVVVFEDDTPLELIKRVRPAVLVKGADWRHDNVVGHDVVEAAGGTVMLVDLVPGHSTTAMVERAQPAKEPAGE